MRRLLLAATAALTACSLDPSYVRPAAPIASAYPSGAAYPRAGTTAGAAVTADTAWRDVFVDPQLRDLIAIALANNRDLRVAVLSIAEAEAQYRVTRADLFPAIGVTGSPLYEGLPDSTNIPATSQTSASTAGSATGTTSSVSQTGSSGGVYRYYTANLGFTAFELDIFGRQRSLSRVSFESFLAQSEQRRAIQISLVAEVASGYLTLCGDQELLTLAQDTMTSQTDSLRLTRMMVNAGTTTLLSLREVEQAVATAGADLAQSRRLVAQDENALTLLLGAPMPRDTGADRGLPDRVLIAAPAAGLPSDLLTRRPDILSAEHELRAANADIGAARAAFFPSIALTASDGVASNQFSQLFAAGAATWLFAPQITIPIFTWGRNAGTLDAAKLQKRIEIATYEKTIQVAFREVADALAARGTYDDQLQSQQALTSAAADSYRLAMLRFRGGVDPYLVVLDSQRTLYGSQQSLIAIKRARLTALVTLYKVLGGGWSEDAKPPPR